LRAAAGHTPQQFADGDIRCTNPVREVMDEARAGSAASSVIGTGRAVDVIGLAQARRVREAAAGRASSRR
jgi:hypothetical protein